MKLILLFLFAVFAEGKFKSLAQKLQDAKDAETETASVVAGVFDVAGFDDDETTGKIAIKVCTHNPTKIHLTKEQQRPTWIDIREENSPMQSGKWRPASNGFRLENQQGEQLHCAASGGKEMKDALLIEYDCTAHKDQGENEPRFARVATSFWLSCPDGQVPYGWPSQWGDFDYPNYAVTETGFYGCTYVNEDGYCFETKDGAAIHANFGYNDSPSNKPVAFFPFDSFTSADLIPGSRFYTSPPPSRGVVISGSTTKAQPSENSNGESSHAEVTEKPGSTASVQPVPPPPVPDTLRLVPSSSAAPFQPGQSSQSTQSSQPGQSSQSTQPGPASRFRGRETTFSTSAPPFTFLPHDSIEEKAQAAAKKEEEIERSLAAKNKARREKVEEEDDE